MFRINSLTSVSQPLKDTSIREPIEQHFMGSRGQFRQSNIGSRRSYNVKQWKEMCESDKYQTPNFFNVREECDDRSVPISGGRTTRSGRVARQAVASTPTPAKKRRTKDESVAPSEAHSFASEELETPNAKAGDDVDMETIRDPSIAEEWERGLAAENGVPPPSELGSVQTTEGALVAEKKPDDCTPPFTPSTVSHSVGPAASTSTLETPYDAQPSPTDLADVTGFIPYANHGGGRKKVSKSEKKKSEKTIKSEQAEKKRKNGEETAQAWEKEWENFEYDTLPWGAKCEDFTVEECQKIEQTYWKRFSLGEPPMYGADGSGSLFDDSTKDWNIAALDDLLMRINPHMPMPGVNTPYLYFGMWRATCELFESTSLVYS